MLPAPETRQADEVRHGGIRLAWILALAYTLLIVHASLQPFRGWRLPPDGMLYILGASWPRYITLEDILVNFAAYVPLGFLLAIALRSRFAAAAAAIMSTLLCASLSLSMEVVQTLLPLRIASGVDLLANGAGALFGAMAAPLFSLPGFPGRAFAAWRERTMLPGIVADTGLVVICLWLFTHLHPTAQLFGTGNLRATLDLPVYLIHTPQRLAAAEAAVTCLNLVGLGLLITLLLRRGASAAPLIAAVAIAGLLVKSVAATVLFAAPAPLNWLTPGVTLGLMTGALLLWPLVRMPRLPMVGTALFCLAAAVAIINIAPENPYQTVPPRLVPGSTTYLLRLSNIVRALSELWPLLAAAWLIGIAARSGRIRRGDRL
jgi:VanZ family protein